MCALLRPRLDPRPCPGTERYGLVASSKAQRFKPQAVDIRVDVDPVHYFLCDRTDTRSSYYIEDPATEFQVQGLALDCLFAISIL